MLGELKKDIPDVSENILKRKLDKAEKKVLEYTNRTELPKELEETVIEIAVKLYNLDGNEGLISKGEGGINATFNNILDNDTKAVLNNYRLPRRMRK